MFLKLHHECHAVIFVVDYDRRNCASQTRETVRALARAIVARAMPIAGVWARKTLHSIGVRFDDRRDGVDKIGDWWRRGGVGTCRRRFESFRAVHASEAWVAHAGTVLIADPIPRAVQRAHGKLTNPELPIDPSFVACAVVLPDLVRLTKAAVATHIARRVSGASGDVARRPKPASVA